LWTTTYLADVLDALRSEGFPITDDATDRYANRPKPTRIMATFER
jgi:hypothetical protein